MVPCTSCYCFMRLLLCPCTAAPAAKGYVHGWDRGTFKMAQCHYCCCWHGWYVGKLPSATCQCSCLQCWCCPCHCLLLLSTLLPLLLLLPRSAFLTATAIVDVPVNHRCYRALNSHFTAAATAAGILAVSMLSQCSKLLLLLVLRCDVGP